MNGRQRSARYRTMRSRASAVARMCALERRAIAVDLQRSCPHYRRYDFDADCAGGNPRYLMGWLTVRSHPEVRRVWWRRLTRGRSDGRAYRAMRAEHGYPEPTWPQRWRGP